MILFFEAILNLSFPIIGIFLIVLMYTFLFVYIQKTISWVFLYLSEILSMYNIFIKFNLYLFLKYNNISSGFSVSRFRILNNPSYLILRSVRMFSKVRFFSNNGSDDPWQNEGLRYNTTSFVPDFWLDIDFSIIHGFYFFVSDNIVKLGAVGIRKKFHEFEVMGPRLKDHRLECPDFYLLGVIKFNDYLTAQLFERAVKNVLAPYSIAINCKIEQYCLRGNQVGCIVKIVTDAVNKTFRNMDLQSNGHFFVNPELIKKYNARTALNVWVKEPEFFGNPRLITPNFLNTRKDQFTAEVLIQDSAVEWSDVLFDVTHYVYCYLVGDVVVCDIRGMDVLEWEPNYYFGDIYNLNTRLSKSRRTRSDLFLLKIIGFRSHDTVRSFVTNVQLALQDYSLYKNFGNVSLEYRVRDHQVGLIEEIVVNVFSQNFEKLRATGQIFMLSENNIFQYNKITSQKVWVTNKFLALLEQQRLAFQKVQ